MATRALIGLGSNLGDRKAHLDAAVAGLAETSRIEVLSVSTHHETAPVGGPGGQGAFLNAAAAVETDLEPLELLRVLQQIENHEGRVRTARWGERTLDLDLLLFGDQIIPSSLAQNRAFSGEPPLLQVPHPWLPFRRFVLAPLVEVAPTAVEPYTGRTIAELLANLDRRPSYVAILDPSGESRDALVRALILAGAEGCPGLARTVGPLPPQSPRSDEGRHVMTLERFAALCDLLLSELSADRWPANQLGERWIVSDFWFDALPFWISHVTSWDARPDAGQDVPNACWERFLAVRSQVIRPTFAVAPTDWACTLQSAEPFGARVSELGGTPILEVDPGNPQASADKVLAACAATRAG